MTEQTISFRDAKRADLLEDIADLEAKLEKKRAALTSLDQEAENSKAIADLKAGDNVAYAYGRAASRRILNGVVRATATNEKGVTQVKVEYGTGLDAEFHLIDASALLFSPEQVDAAQKQIDEAVAEAKAKAAAAEAAAQEKK